MLPALLNAMKPSSPNPARNVLGERLEPCCFAPVTGFFRDGYCRTDANDMGRHVVCAQVTAEFLAFSRDAGNDLSTPRPEYEFPGLKPGDRWCLCALRWMEAYEAASTTRTPAFRRRSSAASSQLLYPNPTSSSSIAPSPRIWASMSRGSRSPGLRRSSPATHFHLAQIPLPRPTPVTSSAT
jgi:hypothetical protein